MGSNLQLGPLSRRPVEHSASRSGGAMPADPLVARQRAFAGVLARGMTTPGADQLSPQDKARQTAEQLVAVAFLQPLLKQLRESSHAAPPFAPTQAEKQFGALSDAELAQQLTHAAHFPLVDRLARDLLRRTSMESAEEALTDGRAAPAPDPARTMTPAFSLTE